MNATHFWWYLSRASGIVSWGLMTVSMLWGILLATRMLRPIDRPAWLLDLHRWLGTLTIIGVAVHLLALRADAFVQFSIADLLVPFASNWRPFAVALGIVAMYLLVIVQLSSLIIKKLPKPLWRSIHLTSYLLFVAVAFHSFLAGSDGGQIMFITFATVLLSVMILVIFLRILFLKTRNKRR